MDILTLGKMNQMAKDVDATLEYLANTTFETLRDVCVVQGEIETTQTGQVQCLEDTTQTGIDALSAAGGGSNGFDEVSFFNTCLVCNGPHTTNAHIGGNGTWVVPDGTNSITFHAWSGGGSGAGHCCQGCWCDIASCGAYSGQYSRKTIHKGAGDFVAGDTYSYCYGEGGNGSHNGGCGCFTVCCNAPQGCRSYVTGPGLSNFCANGARGSYNIYCTCGCRSNANRYCSPKCGGVCVGQNVDFSSGGTPPEFFKSHDSCDCMSRSTKTGESYGLQNSHTYTLSNSATHCGCTNCCAGMHQVAGGGTDQLKSYCGNAICYCNGTPGKPGMVKIEWN